MDVAFRAISIVEGVVVSWFVMPASVMLQRSLDQDHAHRLRMAMGGGDLPGYPAVAHHRVGAMPPVVVCLEHIPVVAADLRALVAVLCRARVERGAPARDDGIPHAQVA